MRYNSVILGNNTDIKTLSYSVRDFYLDRGYSVDIYSDGKDGKRKTVVDASRKKRRLRSVFLSRKGGAVAVESHTYYVFNNILIYGSLIVIQACLGRMIGGMIGADSLCYVIGLLLGIGEALFCFVPAMRENRVFQEFIRTEAVNHVIEVPSVIPVTAQKKAKLRGGVRRSFGQLFDRMKRSKESRQ